MLKWANMKIENKLCILPFDHRGSFTKFINEERVPLAKQIIYESFLKVRENYDGNKDELGILVDKHYGEMILRNAKENGITCAMPVEKSGQDIFDFDNPNWKEDIKNLDPDIVKVLVRYKPIEEEKENNKLQLERLKQVSDFCKETGKPFLFELLTGGESNNTAKAIKEIKEKLDPAVWKLEGVTAGSWDEILEQTGDDKIVVLGRGESDEKVKEWISEAKKYPTVIGFAIGRTVFADAIKAYGKGELTKDEAVNKIAQNYQGWIDRWEERS